MPSVADIRDKVFKKDARKIIEVLPRNSVDVTITSPPYFDLKDYGSKEQIGYGQSYDQYLEDLKSVFKGVYDCSKSTATLWVIIDTFRRDNEVVPLPFDFSNALKPIGWKLQEIIIWEKDRTVPWAHKGQMRNLFEYILMFSKAENYNFFIDEVRDFTSLKKWWIKYPERYNPKGKTPDGLWHFGIPTQGSWGQGYIRHFCPLPQELIAQILKISTKEKDLVLDPFAGSGSVLAKAAVMNRNYVGFELNQSYINMFKKYHNDTFEEQYATYKKQKLQSLSHLDFETLILNLRALKYPRLLLKKLPNTISKQVERIFVKKRTDSVTKRNARVVVEYTLYVKEHAICDRLLHAINEIVQQAPLSKFGIESTFQVVSSLERFKALFGKRISIYAYSLNSTHKYSRRVTTQHVDQLPIRERIFSAIKVDLNEKDYE